MIRNSDELAKMRKAGKVVAEIHEKTRDAVKPGVTTLELDKIARDVLESRNAKSNFLNYGSNPPFPGVICTSVNNEIVHGMPSDRALKEGDVVSVDAGAIIEGYHGDAAYTAAVGEISKDAQRLLDVTARSLEEAIKVMVEGNRLNDIGKAVQEYVESNGFFVVREYVGHAIGTAMHEDPQVPNYYPGTPGPKLKNGMVYAIEPMVNIGGWETVALDDGWTVVTKDGSLSAHFEHTIAVTDNGPEVFTK